METDLEKLRLHSKCNVSWMAANEASLSKGIPRETSDFEREVNLAYSQEPIGSLSCLLVWTLRMCPSTMEGFQSGEASAIHSVASPMPS
ncbi:hypothetical protein MTR67_006026 [Solanum verrucosum]|uniref:Uncharacterized protein n=1 Tax=Solanum verrucosum TaxID=315347 RepID=A0AAF0Q2C1_SOLVR|nr:hypothetical protein MTR67_006026 [Solanum verrucosum]